MDTTRLISTVAYEIVQDWKKPYFGAIPYLKAMLQLSTKDSKYGVEDAETIVVYFLGNANTYRGEVARRTKAELKKLVGLK